MPKSERCRACCWLVLSVVLVLLLGACSRISLESNPLGRTVAKVESKDNQERVNGWPIYYKCGDASSFLWPLYQKSKDGHIVFPLYEYDRSPRCIKPAMGLVGSFQLDRRKYYFMNLWMDLKEKWFTFFPLYFQNYDPMNKMMVFPLFYAQTRGKNQEPEFVSLPFSKGKDFTNIMGLAYHDSNFLGLRITRFAIPLGKYMYAPDSSDCPRRDFRFFPFYKYERLGPSKDPSADDLHSVYQNFALIIYDSKTSGSKTTGSILWPFGHFWKDENGGGSALFPLFITRKDKVKGDYASALFPLTHYWKNSGNTGSAMVPLYAWNKQDNGNYYGTALFPFTHFWKNDQTHGSCIAPVYLHKQDNQGNNKALLTPLWSWGEKDNTKFYSLAGPLFLHESGPKGSSTYVTPLIGAKNSTDTASAYVLPLFGWSKGPDSKSFISLPAGYHKKGDEKTSWVVPLGVYHQDTTKTSVVSLPYGYSRDHRTSETKSWLIPAYFSKSKPSEKEFYSLPFSYGKDANSSWQNYGLLAGHSENNVTKEKTTTVLPLFSYSEDTTNTRFLSLPFSYGNHGYSSWRNLGLAFHFSKNDYRKRYTAALLSHFTKEKDGGWNTGLWPLFKFDREYEEVKAGRKVITDKARWLHWDKYRFANRSYKSSSFDWSLAILANGSRKKTVYADDTTTQPAISIKRRFDLFPLYHSDSLSLSSHSRILFGSIWKSDADYKEERGEWKPQIRRRILWKAMDYEHIGEVTSLDTFPFITYDRDGNTNYSRFSFLGPVFSKTHHGEKKQTQVFGIKIGDDIQQYPPGSADLRSASFGRFLPRRKSEICAPGHSFHFSYRKCAKIGMKSSRR